MILRHLTHDKTGDGDCSRNKSSQLTFHIFASKSWIFRSHPESIHRRKLSPKAKFSFHLFILNKNNSLSKVQIFEIMNDLQKQLRRIRWQIELTDNIKPCIFTHIHLHTDSHIHTTMNVLWVCHSVLSLFAHFVCIGP